MKIYLPLLLAMLTGCIAAPTPTASPSPQPVTPPPGCVFLQMKPTPDPAQGSLFELPGQGSHDHLDGPEFATTTFTVYDDYQCPECAALEKNLERLRQEFPQDVRLVYRHFPLTNAHDKAALALLAAEAAHLQGHFLEMHRRLYALQSEWIGLSPQAFEGYLLQQAEALGLDAQRFRADLHSEALAPLPEQLLQRGLQIGLPGTPLLLINGQVYTGPQDYSSLRFSAALLQLGRRQFSSCPPQVIDSHKTYFATLKLAQGEVIIKLYAQQAPITVNNFVFLARQGWYENIPIHRVAPGLMIQTGDPSGTGAGNPGYLIADENLQVEYNRAGLVGMANAGAGTGGSQFFITLGAAPQFNGLYPLFGEVVSGLEVLQALEAREVVLGAEPLPAVILQSVSVEER